MSVSTLTSGSAAAATTFGDFEFFHHAPLKSPHVGEVTATAAAAAMAGLTKYVRPPTAPTAFEVAVGRRCATLAETSEIVRVHADPGTWNSRSSTPLRTRRDEVRSRPSSSA